MGKSISVTKENIHQLLKENSIVILDFWAEWCGPCKMFAPIFEKAANDNPDVVFGKVDTEIEQDLAMKFAIRSIPTVTVIKNGILISQQAGVLSSAALNEAIVKVKELDTSEFKNKTS